MQWTQTLCIRLGSEAFEEYGEVTKLDEADKPHHSRCSKLKLAILNTLESYRHKASPPRESPSSHQCLSESVFHIGCFQLTTQLSRYSAVSEFCTPFAYLLSQIQTTVVTSTKKGITLGKNDCESLFVLVRAGENARVINHTVVSSLITAYSNRADRCSRQYGEHTELAKRLRLISDMLRFLARAIFEIYFEEQHGESINAFDPNNVRRHSRKVKKDRQSPLGMGTKRSKKALKEELWEEWMTGTTLEGLSLRSRDATHSAERSFHRDQPMSFSVMSPSHFSGKSFSKLTEQIDHAVSNEILSRGERDVRGVDIPEHLKPDAVSFKQALKLAEAVSSLAHSILPAGLTHKDSMGLEGETGRWIFLLNMGLFRVPEGPKCGAAYLASSFFTRFKALHPLGDILTNGPMNPPRGTVHFHSKKFDANLYVHERFIAKVSVVLRENQDHVVDIEWLRNVVGEANFAQEWKRVPALPMKIRGVACRELVEKERIRINILSSWQRKDVKVTAAPSHYSFPAPRAVMLYFEFESPSSLPLALPVFEESMKVDAVKTFLAYGRALKGCYSSVIGQALLSTPSKVVDESGFYSGFYVGVVEVPPGESVEGMIEAFAPFAGLFARVQTTLIRRMHARPNVPIIEPLLMLVVKAGGKARDLNRVLGTALHYACCERLVSAAEQFGWDSCEARKMLDTYKMGRCISRAIFELYSLSNSVKGREQLEPDPTGPFRGKHAKQVEISEKDKWRKWLGQGALPCGIQRSSLSSTPQRSFESREASSFPAESDDSLSLFQEQVSHCIANAFQKRLGDISNYSAQAIGLQEGQPTDRQLEQKGGGFKGEGSEVAEIPRKSGFRKMPYYQEAALIRVPLGHRLSDIQKDEAVSLAATLTRAARLSTFYLHEPLERDEGSGLIMLLDMGLVGVQQHGHFDLARLAVGFPTRLQASDQIGLIRLDKPVSPPQATQHWTDDEAGLSLYVHPTFVARVSIEKTKGFAKIEWVHSLGEVLTFKVKQHMKQEKVYPIGNY